MCPSSGAAAASWNAKDKVKSTGDGGAVLGSAVMGGAKDKVNDDERRAALKTALGGAMKPLTRYEVINTALMTKPKSTGDGDAVLGGAVMGGANPRPTGAVLGGSSATQLSARRLERHGVRMEMRKVSAHHGVIKPIASTTARSPIVTITAPTPAAH